MRHANHILTVAVLGGLLWAMAPQGAVAGTATNTAQFRVQSSAGLRVAQVRYPYRGYYRPYVAPYYRPSYGYGVYYGNGAYYGNGYAPYVATPYATPYYAARPYHGYGARPYYGGYRYGRARAAYRYGW